MKKNILLLLLIFLTGCSIASEKTYLSKKLDLNLDNCKIKSEDTHGGFLGDGTYFAKITCENVDKKVSNWNSLPYSDDIKEALNMQLCDEFDCLNVFEKYNIPEISSGNYYFLDRYSNDLDKKNGLNDRPSYNFTIAIFDNDKTIYFYELDT